jgi:tetratricopeptide (TPR) repeat protein
VFGSYGEEVALPRHFSLRVYLRQQPVMLAMLSVLAVLFFLGATGLSRAYYAQRQGLGSRWFNRGMADLRAGRFPSAVTEFRSALLYSRDDFDYQLNLAEALIGMKHTGEASAYLLNLWDREPDNGLVNLELARIAAQQGQIKEATRYYHDAVYAAWPPGDEGMRREARFELIQLLLRVNDRAQAEAELIALSENVGDDPLQQERIGDLFVKAQDYERALAAYRVSLKADKHNEADLAGAGLAAYELGRYAEAQHYLQAAVTHDPKDEGSSDRLKTTELVLHMDPYRRPITSAERARLVKHAFDIAGERLKTCAIPTNAPATAASSPPLNLNDEWATARPKVTETKLRESSDLVDSTMDLVFRIERQTSILCGTPTGEDRALLLIAKLHEGM